MVTMLLKRIYIEGENISIPFEHLEELTALLPSIKKKLPLLEF